MITRSTTIQDFYAPNPVEIPQVLLWQYENTIALKALILQKSAWYQTWVNEFWDQWIDNVFNLTTANAFGLSVWAIILNTPLFINTSPQVDTNLWGFNAYVPYPTLQNSYTNFDNGNFVASSESISLSVEQQRFLLRLKYLKLVSRGSIAQTNYNLNWLMTDTSMNKGLFPAYQGSPLPGLAPTIVVTGNTLLGSNIMPVSDTSRLQIGMQGYGSGLVGNSYIISIDTVASTIALSTNASSTELGQSYNFGLPTAWVLENFNMQMTYQFNFYLPVVMQRAINAAQVLPEPAGVLVTKQYWNGTQYVNF